MKSKLIYNLTLDGDQSEMNNTKNGTENMMVLSNGPPMVGLELKDSNNLGMNFSD